MKGALGDDVWAALEGEGLEGRAGRAEKKKKKVRLLDDGSSFVCEIEGEQRTK